MRLIGMVDKFAGTNKRNTKADEQGMIVAGGNRGDRYQRTRGQHGNIPLTELSNLGFHIITLCTVHKGMPGAGPLAKARRSRFGLSILSGIAGQ